MKDPKNITLILIPYITICGAFFHIAYWDTFCINGLAFITISDIIKSSVYPFLSSAFFIFIGMFAGLVFNPFEKHLPAGQGKETKVGKKLNSKVGSSVILIIWIILLYVIIHYGITPFRWLVFGFLAALPPAIWLDSTGIWSNIFSNHKIRLVVFELMFYLPVFAFSIGKFNSELIYTNEKYKYTIIQNSGKNQSDTLKLLGTTEKHFIFSDLKNTKELFLKSDNLDTLVLFDKNN